MNIESARHQLGRNLTTLLADRGLTQADVAVKSGQSAMQVHRICSGRHMPSAYSLHQIAQQLNVEISKLMG
jgi:transcriptional regulator with XRE-family HTH domain